MACMSSCVVLCLQYNTTEETLTLSLTGATQPSVLHVWQTVFGWEGNKQVESTFFKQLPVVKVIGGQVSVLVPVDAIITLTTQTTSKSKY